jgi:hypothetical protein
MAVEEPKYAVLLKEGAFEIRDYPDMVAAEVTVTGDQKGAARKGFRLLAGYIFGGNRRREKIAMTAPVAQIPAGGHWVIRFTMPAGLALETLPEPNDPQVQLTSVPPARFAVVRYSGIASQANFQNKAAELIGFIKARHLRPVGEATLAQYDPPWTPWFMRRNEVILQLER